MGWIKRNLFIAIGSVVALVLLGGGGFFIYQGWSRNSAAASKLNENYNTLVTLAQKKPAPGSDKIKINNTAIAREQEQQLEEWIKSAGEFFQPVAAIPSESPVTSEAYAAALSRTIGGLQREAGNSSVSLPPKYDFSFSAQRPLVKFAAGSLEPLAVQLGEVKAVAEILFDARINALVGIQRVRVSDDDIGGPQSDYLDLRPVTNELAVLTPYVVTFRSFTPELARVLSQFAASSNAFIVKSINVQPASGAVMPADATGAAYGGMPRRFQNETVQPPAGTPPPSPTQGKGGVQTVLKEQMLQITLEVELVKLLPKTRS
jgi:hypothetical protein